MTEFPTAHRILASLNDVWTDLTGYVIEDITGSWGIQGNGALDLLADAGAMHFTLNNMDQRFTPGHASALSGWEKGIEVKLEIDYEGGTYVHLGTISDIDVPLDDDLFDRAYVTVHDWLEFSAMNPIVNPGILTNQRGDDVIRALLTLIPKQPRATDLDVGVSVFPATWDTVTSHTKGYSELSRVAFSEPGYVYLRKDKLLGETLVFESAHARNGLRELDILPLGASESGALKKEDGGYLLKEDGGKILLNQVGSLFADNSMIDVESDYGDGVINYITLRANPRRLSASAEILFQLDEPIPIGSSQTIEIRGSYADPQGGFPINGQDMIAPVITTDYLANTAQDGSGTNISANLTIVTGYGTEGFTHQVTNGSTSNGWITKFNCRGTGIYNYNPIEHVEKDNASITRRGYQTATLDQKYQSTLDQGRIFIETVVELEAEPQTKLHKVTFLANQSSSLMMAFLNFGPGNLIRIKHDRRGIDSWFYIQGVSEYKITSGGLIMYTWIVKQALTLGLGLSLMAVEFGGHSTTDAINFGYIPHLANLTQRSVSVWIYLDSDSPTGFYGIACWGVNYLTMIKPDRRAQVYNVHPGGGGVYGIWLSPVNSVPLTAWTHIVFTHDLSTATNDPIIYINGASQTLTESSTPAGAVGSETGDEFVIGNAHYAGNEYGSALDGKLKDVRVYDRILSAAEVTALYNSGTPDATLVRTGMDFQAFAVRTQDVSAYTNLTLTAADKLMDAVHYAIGTPHGNPVARTP